jgi:hypothetical protein
MRASIRRIGSSALGSGTTSTMLSAARSCSARRRRRASARRIEAGRRELGYLAREGADTGRRGSCDPRPLADVAGLLRGDTEGARDALRALRGEPFRAVMDAEGYGLTGALKVKTASPRDADALLPTSV